MRNIPDRDDYSADAIMYSEPNGKKVEVTEDQAWFIYYDSRMELFKITPPERSTFWVRPGSVSKVKWSGDQEWTE